MKQKNNCDFIDVLFVKKTLFFCFIFFLNSTFYFYSQTVKVSAIGDVMAHIDLQNYVLNSDLGYYSYFDKYKQIFLQDDITFANIEVPICDSHEISGYPRFNAHSQLIEAAKKSGIDVVSLANNHAYDQTDDGIKGSIQACIQNELLYAGVGLTPLEAFAPTIFEKNGIVFGFLSTTYSINGIPIKYQEDKPYVNLIDLTQKDLSESQLLFLETVKTLKQKVDIVVVAFHFGIEYTEGPAQDDLSYLHLLAENGADLIIGHHPHVVHGSEDYITKDNRQVFILHSLGNFFSAQARYFHKKNQSFDKLKNSLQVRTAESLVVSFDIIKDNDKICFVNKKIIPLFNIEFQFTDTDYGYKLFPMQEILSDDFADKDALSLPEFDLLKKIVQYRYDSIENRVGILIKKEF